MRIAIAISDALTQKQANRFGPSQQQVMLNRHLSLARGNSISQPVLTVSTALMPWKEKRFGTLKTFMPICRLFCTTVNYISVRGTGRYRIYAVDAQTGTEIWSKQMPYPVWGTPSTDDNLVFFGIGRGQFFGQ